MNAFPIIAPEASGTELERATLRGEVLETSARMEARCHYYLFPLAWRAASYSFNEKQAMRPSDFRTV